MITCQVMEATNTITSPVQERSGVTQRLKVTFWLAAMILGVFQAWAYRHAIDTDGIAYLDIGEAYLHGNWNQAINGYWAPLYSWLIGLALFFFKPTPFWEFPAIHFLNFVVYLTALGCFEFFFCEFLAWRRLKANELSKQGLVTLSEPSWLMLGYTFFIWSSLNLISIREVTPDLCVSALVYLASGLLLRIRRKPMGWLSFALLGVTLGFGYLAKAAMFLLAFVFLGASLFSVGNLKRAVPRLVIALSTFAVVSSPFIVALSLAKGRPTFSDNPRYNYAFSVKRDSYYQARYYGTRKLFNDPAIYEFGTPVGGTYPLSYDPSYWGKDAPAHFDLRGQIKTLVLSLKEYYRIFFTLQSALILGCLILFLMSGRHLLTFRDIRESWPILVPAAAALGMYSLVCVLPRYIAPFLSLLWLGIFSGVRLPDLQQSRKLLIVVISVTTAMIMVSVARDSYPTARDVVRDLIKGEDKLSHTYWQVANGLNQIGIKPGDKATSIGSYSSAFWARLARVRIVAEMPSEDVGHFWAANAALQSEVIRTFASTGAKVIVAEKAPEYASSVGWQKIKNTDFFVYLLK